MNYVLIAIILLLLIYDFYEWKAKRRQNAAEAEQTEAGTSDAGNTKIQADHPKTEDFSKAYQFRLLLTKNEYRNYHALREITDPMHMIVCPKVRLLDLVEPRAGARRQQLLFNKVQSKHVDFVVCDNGLHVKLILELDDSSHDAPYRQSRDEFVDIVLGSCGYRIIHSRDFGADKSLIQTALEQMQGKPQTDRSTAAQETQSAETSPVNVQAAVEP